MEITNTEFWSLTKKEFCDKYPELIQSKGNYAKLKKDMFCLEYPDVAEHYDDIKMKLSGKPVIKIKPSYLYAVLLSDGEREVLKIGKANVPAQRYKQYGSGYTCKEVDTRYFENVKDVFKAETAIKKKFAMFRLHTDVGKSIGMNNGMNECYNPCIVEEVKEYFDAIGEEAVLQEYPECPVCAEKGSQWYTYFEEDDDDYAPDYREVIIGAGFCEEEGVCYVHTKANQEWQAQREAKDDIMMYGIFCIGFCGVMLMLFLLAGV